jgi:bacillithiol biosynthesis cysteine-adding enzyme BshC
MEMVENPTVETTCLPFSSIPSTTRLFDDFLHHFDKVRAFYSRPPLARDWWEEEKRRVVYPGDRRSAVAGILERQNREFGAGQRTFQNLLRFREGAPVIVTGQQVGLFGGPAFCLLKALSVARLAEEAGAVPVFWLASEDHDFEEISFANFPVADHLQKFTANVPHKEGAQVGAIAFGHEISAAVEQVQALYGASEVSAILAESYRPGESFSGAFARFYARVLQGLGIVFLDPRDRELHRVAQPLYQTALENAEAINTELQEREKELESAGYHAQVKVTHSHTLCFYLEDGVRTPVRLEGESFLVAERKLSRAELIAETERCPERFSANVLLRPVIEDYLLPSLSYVGGPAEIAYFAQAEIVYRHLLGRVTPVLPRIFATLIEPRQAKLLSRYQLTLPDIFITPEKLREVVGAHALPENVMQSFDAAAAHLDQALNAIQPSLEKLDKTLVDAAENAASKMRYQLQGLRDKAARAEARKNSELVHQADELSTFLYPNKDLQEREIAAAYFLMKYGVGLIETLNQNLKVDCPDHQVVTISA